MNRTLPRLFASAALVLVLGGNHCSGEPTDDNADSDGTAETGGGGETGESGGDGAETGDSGGADTDPDCPLGAFDCPCNDGVCDAGLTCGPDNVCALGGSETGNPTTTETDTSNPTTTGVTGAGSSDPYDPEECEAPSEVLDVEQIDGEFCATPCVEHEDCPAGPEGTNASCSISTVGGVPNFCTLICVPNSESCPMGSTCKVIPQQPNTGLCTYP